METTEKEIIKVSVKELYNGKFLIKSKPKDISYIEANKLGSNVSKQMLSKTEETERRYGIELNRTELQKKYPNDVELISYDYKTQVAEFLASNEESLINWLAINNHIVQY